MIRGKAKATLVGMFEWYEAEGKPKQLVFEMDESIADDNAVQYHIDVDGIESILNGGTDFDDEYLQHEGLEVGKLCEFCGLDGTRKYKNTEITMQVGDDEDQLAYLECDHIRAQTSCPPDQELP